MQTTEINGFVIDEFNIHKLETGKKQGTCPLCSHTRKPKNQKAKCASYDWERGLGTCHNCNTSFQLHTYQRKGASERVYVRPDQPDPEYPGKTYGLDDKVLKWFETRGISPETLLDVGVGQGSEWMPQTGKTENTIKFQYFII